MEIAYTLVKERKKKIINGQKRVFDLSEKYCLYLPSFQFTTHVQLLVFFQLLVSFVPKKNI